VFGTFRKLETESQSLRSFIFWSYVWP